VLDIVQQTKPNCKFVTVLADIVSINKLWIDDRVCLTICPTEESYCIAKSKGIEPNRLCKINFPTRTQIVDKALTLDKYQNNFKTWHTKTDQKDNSTPLNCVLISGGEGSGKIIKQANKILSLPYTNLSIICGKNSALKQNCISIFGSNSRVKVYGFVDDMASLILQHSIAVVRGSPNVIMECINLLVPIVVVSTLPGQERGNDKYVEQNNLGLSCKKITELPNVISKLNSDNGQLLYTIKQNQYNYRDLSAADKIAIAIKNL